jgi:hypothetical protein
MLIPIGFLGAGGASGSYELIESTILGSATASVTFTSGGAWAGYKHLQVRATLKNSSSDTDLRLRFNSDTGNNYALHNLYGYSGSVASNAVTSTSAIVPGFQAISSETNQFGSMILDILDFQGTKNKTIRSFTGNAGSSISYVSLRSGLWTNTAALTSLTLIPTSGNLAANCRFSLYGIK